MLDRGFFQRDTRTVARQLLGKVLVHKTIDGVTSGVIIETEAYFGPEDPASRARKRTRISELMWQKAGLAMVYMVHANWLLNVTTEKKGNPGAVLIRALEPLEGVDLMKKRRSISEIKNLTSGPGKLTQAMGITGEYHGVDLLHQYGLRILEGVKEDLEDLEISKSQRIGVTEDLEEELRFFISGNEFVSR
ncbi:MAG: DNA-3-methyladenine glycosylase [Archaeoglobaceae archaeon]